MGQPIFEENGAGRLPRASTSCARSAASTRACRAACTCTSARARRSGRCTRRCSASTAEAAAWTTRRHASGSRGSRRCSRRSRASPTRGPRDARTELVAALLDLYGEGLGADRRHVAERDDGTLARALADDELVAHLLLLHGLHPVPLEERVRGALDEVRPVPRVPRRRRRAARVEDGVVRLRMEGSCNGCPSSAMTLKLAIEEAIHKAAPGRRGDRGRGRRRAGAAGRLLQLELEPAPARAAPAPRRPGAWTTAGALPELADGGALLQGGRRRAGAVLRGRRARSTPTGPAARPAASRSRGATLQRRPSSRCPACGHALRRAPRGPLPRRPRSSTSSRCRCSSTTPGWCRSRSRRLA